MSKAGLLSLELFRDFQDKDRLRERRKAGERMKNSEYGDAGG